VLVKRVRDCKTPKKCSFYSFEYWYRANLQIEMYTTRYRYRKMQSRSEYSQVIVAHGQRITPFELGELNRNPTYQLVPRNVEVCQECGKPMGECALKLAVSCSNICSSRGQYPLPPVGKLPKKALPGSASKEHLQITNGNVPLQRWNELST
jgi:hypothetical protein